ncbi:Stress responsive A/B Barrel Domain [Pricia antarctica]|uniref:Stress responsive A/B Barrel Domain n=1 Tax=Pricia antarctica TaxID=641691 RepID=A0A1G6ZWT2_9FLAO|nr:Dabb family protein [Pricia antarctica]SDE07009.1 Stress responsive A/B Barrel Domain [Pricia antarctica]
MKTINQVITLLLVFLSLTLVSFNRKDLRSNKTELTMQQDSLLRHVVMFKFKEDTSKEDIRKVQEAFSALPSKIPQIVSYEWGTNNSPEGLDKGFTHIFFLTFNSEEDRAVYLPHPDHKAFGEILGPSLDDVLVLDYWSSKE